MPLITWDESFSVNVKKIDEQHQKLIGMINDLHDAMKERRGEEALADILDRMFAYTKEHFATEEHYFDIFHYDDAEVHKAQHQAFIDKVTEFRQKFDKKEAALSIEVMGFLRDWLTNHIKKSDKLYTPLFNERGLI